ncbi:MAG TPA: helix-turn-helix domain-containing protein [Gemmatimonadaceae bacterium]
MSGRSPNVPADTSHADGPRVVALLAHQGRASRVRAAFGDQASLCESTGQLLARSRARGVELVIVGAPSMADAPLTTTITAIRASRQSPPVYIYGDRSIESARQLMALARAGARGLILLDVDDDASSLRRLLTRGKLADAIETVAMAMQPVVSARHLPLFTCCIEHIAEPPSALAVARQLKVSRRTLSAWARQAGARGVRSMTSKCRVLAALEMIRASDRSIEQVAHELRFASSAHLHNTIRRYTGRRPRDAAREGAPFWCRRLFATSPPAETNRPRAEWSSVPNDPILPPRIRKDPEESMT